jgi:hypothetical protein
MADDWRRIIATLADPVRRQVYASVVLDVPIDLPPKKREKALAVRDGRIEQYPVRSDDRLEFLTWARDRALPGRRYRQAS